MNSTPPGPPPCLPPFQCVKVEEWLKSSEKTKVKLICTPHRSPLQKITTQKTRTSLTLQLIDFPSHSPTETHTHSSTSTARHPQFTLSSAFTARTRNSPTLQLLPHEPAIHPLFDFYHTKPGIHSLFNFLYGLPNLAISYFAVHRGRFCSTHTRFLHDLTYLRNFEKSDNLCIQTYIWEAHLPSWSWHIPRMDSIFESASQRSLGSTM